MPELDDILDREFDHDLLYDLFDHIVETKCADLEEYESYSKRMSEGERIVVLVQFFLWEVINGGLHQFLTNDSGNCAEETRLAMRTIGATAAADALDGVRQLIFGDKPTPADRSGRCEILLAWEAKDEGRSNRCFDQWSDSIFAEGDLAWSTPIESAIARYIRSHRDMFE